MEEHHSSIMGRTPHWYLWYFGTDPNCTGAAGPGSGSRAAVPHSVVRALLRDSAAVAGEGYDEKLMKKVLSMVDDSELPCYLECTDPTQLSFYKAHGFNVEEYHEQPTLSYMLRPERKKSEGGGAAAPAPEPAAAEPAVDDDADDAL